MNQVEAQVSLKGVRSLLGTTSDTKALAALDQLLGAALLLSPIFTGFAGLAGLTLITPKNELLRLAQKAVHRRDPDIRFTEKCSRMAAAYCLNHFVAFFTALDEALPDIAALMDLQESERASLAHTAAEGLPEDLGHDLTDVEVRLPGAARGLSAERPARARLFSLLTDGTKRFLRSLHSWEKLQAAQRAEVLQRLDQLSESAEAAFLGQHVYLLAEFPEFLAWNDMQHREEMFEALSELGESITILHERFGQTGAPIDVGLERLDELVAALPSASSDELTTRVAADLSSRYKQAIERPVIVDALRNDETDVVYPLKSRAYVPQSFKVLQYDGRQHNLEDEGLWRRLDAQGDIGQFIIGYLETPYSLQTPLLLLGLPGSGKSLLTEMLAARLTGPKYNTVRVALRDIEPEDSLQTQIEKSIHEQTGRRVDWAAFAEGSTHTPPVVILDGFDELLQASGQVFSTYLEKIEQFQQREADLNRPLRVLVTSRLALIDRARVPDGSTVVRLLEFDAGRRDRWASIWNQVNSDGFAARGVTPFIVPAGTTLAPLAQQPLLLLMLALYDSESNALAQEGELDQTLLYHNLLSRFIRREQTKGNSADVFGSLRPEEQQAAVDRDLERLGVAALGMYNRQSLHISRQELERDIRLYAMAEDRTPQPGRVLLGEADLLLGSFFFIHEAVATTGAVAANDAPRAFEFLHNTFGEFLAADFILRHLLRRVELVHALSASSALLPALDQALVVLEKQLLACFLHTSLCSRPVIVTMLREWSRHRLRGLALSEADFGIALTALVDRQLAETLSASELVNLLDGDEQGTVPALGQHATFTLNLVVLCATLSPAGFECSDVVDGSSGSHNGAWSRLTYVWRSWFSREELSQVADLLTAVRTGQDVRIQFSQDRAERVATSQLRTVADVADVLSDELVAGLAGLLLWEDDTSHGKMASAQLDAVAARLRTGGLNAERHISVRRSWIAPPQSAGDAPQESPDAGISPARQALLAVQAVQARERLTSYLQIRGGLRPGQWRPEDATGEDVASGLRALLDLNAAVEPRFIVHLLRNVLPKSPDDLRRMLRSSPGHAEAIILACLPIWHLGDVGLLLDYLQSLTAWHRRLRIAVALTVLAARRQHAQVLAQALGSCATLTSHNVAAFGDVGPEELQLFCQVLSDPRTGNRQSVAACKGALVTYLAAQTSPQGDNVGEQLPVGLLASGLSLAPRKSPEYRAMARVLTATVYAAPARDLLTVLQTLHARNDVALLRTLATEGEFRGKWSASVVGVLDALANGLRDEPITSTAADALAWAIEKSQDPTVGS